MPNNSRGVKYQKVNKHIAPMGLKLAGGERRAAHREGWVLSLF